MFTVRIIQRGSQDNLMLRSNLADSQAEDGPATETAAGQDVLINDAAETLPNTHQDEPGQVIGPLDNPEPLTIPHRREDQASQQVAPYIEGTSIPNLLPYEYIPPGLVVPPTYNSADMIPNFFGDIDMLQPPVILGHIHAPPTFSSLCEQGCMSRVRRGYIAFIDFVRKPHMALGASVMLRPAATVIIVSDLAAIFAYINLTVDRDGLYRLDFGHQILQLMGLHNRHKAIHFPVPGTRTICGLWLTPDSLESDAEMLQRALLGILLSPEVHVYRPQAGVRNLPGLAFTLLENGQGVAYLDNERIERVDS